MSSSKFYILFLTLCLSCQVVSQDENSFRLMEVVDGDTIRLIDGTDDGLLVRMIGINTPEARDFKHRKEEKFGKEASAYLKSICSERITLEYDVESKDKYGRTLAYCFNEDGTHLNLAMIKAGWAEVMTIPPNVKYADEFVQALQTARKQKKGMWQDAIP
ncbi:thermonuclease family protein [bacterium]|nr:thermonuclease family protein [bacterium]